MDSSRKRRASVSYPASGGKRVKKSASASAKGSLASQVKRLLAGQKKTIAANSAAVMNTAFSDVYINDPAIHNLVQNFTGPASVIVSDLDKVQLVEVSFSAHMKSYDGAILTNAPLYVRLACVYDAKPNGTLAGGGTIAAVSDFLTTPTSILSPWKTPHENAGRFSVLWDQTYQLGANTATQTFGHGGDYIIKKTIKINKPLETALVGSYTQPYITKGNVYLIALAEGDTGTSAECAKITFSEQRLTYVG